MVILELNTIYNEDYLTGMLQIEDKSIDMILCDLPYGVTAKNKWDVVIPFEPLWEQYNRIIKDNGAIVLFGQDKFTARLMLSNEKYHRYNLIWNKTLPTGFLNANRMPLRSHEDICVFYKKLPTYNPQKTKGKPCHSRGKALGKNTMQDGLVNNTYSTYTLLETKGDMKYPVSILEFPKPHPSICIHPSQKNVDLLEWLIKSYTNEGELVLDNCMGSGSTAIACINTNRNFIGFEKDSNYHKLATERINKHKLG